MQIWQLFIIPRHPATLSVTVFTITTKLTNDLFKTAPFWLQSRYCVQIKYYPIAGPSLFIWENRLRLLHMSPVFRIKEELTNRQKVKKEKKEKKKK